MRNEIAFRSAAWYGDSDVTYAFPPSWDISVPRMADADKLTKEQIRQSLENPVGTPSLEEMAWEHHRAVILCEDHTRPLVLHDVMLCVLDQLNRGGISDDRIIIQIANGTHRPMTHEEQVKKFGVDVLRRVSVLDHNCYDNLRYIGDTQAGTPLYVDKNVGESDLLIGLSGVYPHGMAGYSGGAKIVLPGIAGIDSIEYNHRSLSGHYLQLQPNGFRQDMEEAARKVGLCFSVNSVVNSRREICALRAGDFILAHKAACEAAGKVYTTKMPVQADVLFINAYPMDSELFQAAKALEIANFYPGTKYLVLLAPCAEGFGYHALCGPGGRMYCREVEGMRQKMKGRELIVVSPNVSRHDILKKLPPETVLVSDLSQAVRYLDERLNGHIGKVVFYPYAPIQIPEQ